MRFEDWAGRHPARLGGISVSLLSVRVVRRFTDVRVMGLAAEMTYYALLSFFPLIGALGASLGFLERVAGTAGAEAAEMTILRALETVFTPEVAADVIAPLVHGLLREERAGFALGGFLISLFFASRIFRSAIDTLDAAFHVEERRGTLALWGLGVLYALGAVLVGHPRATKGEPPRQSTGYRGLSRPAFPGEGDLQGSLQRPGLKKKIERVRSRDGAGCRRCAGGMTRS